MLFNSIDFLLFFPIVVILFFIIPHKYRWLHLLVASCVFYMFFIPVYILILFFTIIVDYYAGITIENSEGKKRKWMLYASLVANIGVLAVFKYYNFFTENINQLFHQLHITTHEIPYLKIILPIGLSFHTFQAMSYTLEVYYGRQKAEKHFGIYALYVMFFPQLVAGPIERPQNILHQFYEKQKPDYNNFVVGFTQIMYGLFKKVVVADSLAMYVDVMYKNYTAHSGSTLLFATFLYAIQIYCDFSGYSEMALGTARIMGFRLMKNFDSPYFSNNISDFWKRWHISLSSWFYEYLFNPIVVELRNNNTLALCVGFLSTFLISGLWHGANWTFILWGGYHGTLLLIYALTKKSRKKMWSFLPDKISNFISIILTFAFVCIGYILFRSTSVHQAFEIINRIFTWTDFGTGLAHFNENIFSTVLILVPILFCIEYFVLRKKSLENIVLKNKMHVVILIHLFLWVMILLFGVSEGSQFIYFQF